MLDTSKCPYFSIMKLDKVDNGIGGFVEKEVELFKIQGFLDLLSGDERTTHNTFMQESTHIILTDYRKDIKTKDCFILDEDGNKFDITLVDDPVNLHQHLEIYLKFVGNK